MGKAESIDEFLNLVTKHNLYTDFLGKFPKLIFFCTLISKFDSSNLYTCEICGKSFQSNNSLKTHEATHKEVPSPCDICNKVFKSIKH